MCPLQYPVVEIPSVPYNLTTFTFEIQVSNTTLAHYHHHLHHHHHHHHHRSLLCQSAHNHTHKFHCLCLNAINFVLNHLHPNFSKLFF